MLSYASPGIIRANCTLSPCKLCHGDLVDRLTPNGSPRFARTTGSATRRAIASSTFRKRGNKSEAARQESRKKLERSLKKRTVKGPHLLTLPVELRCQIYAACLTYDGHTGSPRVISGWVEGGGWHPDYPSNYPSTNLFATKIFPVQLLLLCKIITEEATEELYRLNHFRINAPSPAQISQVHYWLGKHPVRFTSHLTIPFGIHLGKAGFEKTVLGSQDVALLARIIKAMPRLVELHIPLLIHANQFSTIRSLSRKGIENIFASLFQLAEALCGKIRLHVNVVFQVWTHHQFHRNGPFVPFSEDKKSLLRSFLKDSGINMTESSDLSHTMTWNL
jgi:hypothetical protein